MNTRRIITSVGIVVAIAALAVLWALFRPELLFVNAAVNEADPVAAVSTLPASTSSASVVLSTALAKPTARPTASPEIADSMPTAAPTVGPTVAPTAAPTVAPTVAPTAKSVGWSATFQSLAHETRGTANVRTLSDGSHVLRLEGFATSNGPDVRVYLVRGSDGTQDSIIQQGNFIDLGALKGNIGDQNYVIPADVDLDAYQAVSIWCRRFSVNFGATMLSAGA